MKFIFNTLDRIAEVPIIRDGEKVVLNLMPGKTNLRSTDSFVENSSKKFPFVKFVEKSINKEEQE